jgi:DNA-binding CsgD family transcriptional regulator
VEARRDNVPLANREFLTIAEHRVLAHIADGRTNDEIAAMLAVSPNTVHTHVAHILHKLDVPSRRHAGRIFRTLDSVDAELVQLLQRNGPMSPGNVRLEQLLERLGVTSLEDARRLYRSVITRSG